MSRCSLANCDAAELGQVQTQARSLWAWTGVLGTAALALLLLAGVALMRRRVRRPLAMGAASVEQFTQAFGLSHGMLRTKQGRIIFWAGGMEQLYGYTGREAVGQISHELLAAKFLSPCSQPDMAPRDCRWNCAASQFWRNRSGGMTWRPPWSRHTRFKAHTPRRPVTRARDVAHMIARPNSRVTSRQIDPVTTKA